MSTLSTLRAAYRPHGIVAATCRRCAYFDVCGGIETDFPLLNCFDLFCPGGGKCQHVCPCQSDFVERMEEVRGLRFDNLSRISQVPFDLPPYIPVIHHGYRRAAPLRWPVVALDTYECFRLSSGTYQAVAESPEELRKAFRRHADTRVVMPLSVNGEVTTVSRGSGAVLRPHRQNRRTGRSRCRTSAPLPSTCHGQTH